MWPFSKKSVLTTVELGQRWKYDAEKADNPFDETRGWWRLSIVEIQGKYVRVKRDFSYDKPFDSMPISDLLLLYKPESNS